VVGVNNSFVVSANVSGSSSGSSLKYGLRTSSVGITYTIDYVIHPGDNPAIVSSTVVGKLQTASTNGHLVSLLSQISVAATGSNAFPSVTSTGVTADPYYFYPTSVPTAMPQSAVADNADVFASLPVLIGIIVGGVVFLALCILGISYCYRNSKGSEGPSTSDNASGSGMKCPNVSCPTIPSVTCPSLPCPPFRRRVQFEDMPEAAPSSTPRQDIPTQEAPSQAGNAGGFFSPTIVAPPDRSRRNRDGEF
jgi:hypothetical protein